MEINTTLKGPVKTLFYFCEIKELKIIHHRE